MGLNPVEVSAKIYDRYKSYVQTSFKMKDENLNEQLEERLKEPFKFNKGPIVEITPAFETSKSIGDLIQEGVMTDEFLKLNNLENRVIDIDRSLYVHQEKAIRKISEQNKNIIVSTGTGSGKTECFLLPILNDLLAQSKKGELGPGIRALFLYPMNALANDQMKRLRKLLENYEDISFGIYTGETETLTEDALVKYREMFGKEPKKNELISRNQMIEAPPNIFITNYAMLEYLMLRPKENVFFSEKYAAGWKYIVLDEAHTYTGAKGIETSLLLQRLKASIGAEKNKLRCIMTSASLGKGVEDAEKVVSFAEKLFNEPFMVEDIIVARKKYFDTSTELFELPGEFFSEACDIIVGNNDENEMISLLKKYKVSKDLVQYAQKNQKNNNASALLYQLLLKEKTIIRMIELLSQKPVDLLELANQLYPDHDKSVEITSSLIDLCNQLREDPNDNPLIPARYHYFVRALEGAYLAIGENNTKKIFLDRQKEIFLDQERYHVFEMGSCQNCKGIYLLGEIYNDGKTGKIYLAESRKKFLEEDKEISFFAVLDDEIVSLNDEIDEDEEEVEIVLKEDEYYLCTKCGCLIKDNEEQCTCKKPYLIRLLKVPTKNNKIHKCGLCGATNTKRTVVRRFHVGEDAIASVLSTALYQQMPEPILEEKIEEKKPSKNLILGKSNLKNEKRELAKTLRKTNKRLLVFSDSRQNAAFFASYIDNSYERMLSKNLMYTVLNENAKACIDNVWNADDFAEAVFSKLAINKYKNNSKENLKKLAYEWVYSEMQENIDTSLEKLGLVQFEPILETQKYRYDSDSLFEELFEAEYFAEFGLTAEETKILFSFLIDQFRVNLALHSEIDYLSHANQEHRNCAFSLKTRSSKSTLSTKSFLPSKLNYSNTRKNYLEKIFAKKQIALKAIEIENFLETIYTEVFVNDESLLSKYFVKSLENLQLKGSVYQVIPPQSKEWKAVYKCDKCKKITKYNIEGICPNYKCTGTLHPHDLKKEIQENHYKKIYTEIDPIMLVAREHTAQLSTQYAAEIQNQFTKGEVNFLSCSTTFELGVDVGDLETVFMKNMPPTPANYIQRAGRAGRNKKTTAFALTYARLSSHDFSNFRNPEKMISGIIKPPYFEVENEKIALRHVYACAFSFFWKQYGEYFDTVEAFFFSEKAGPVQFKEFLSKKPLYLKNFIRKVLTPKLVESLQIETWGWVEQLYSEDGVMSKVCEELYGDIEYLEKEEENASSKKLYEEAKKLEAMRKTIKNRKIISFLAQKNLLPKYGFPVDVVNLEIRSNDPSIVKNIELSRDLALAISEYAPDSEVIANGKVWTSRYIKKIPKRDWVQYYYVACQCGYFKKSLKKEELDQWECKSCGRHLRQGIFILPEFGFISEKDYKLPTMARPQKTYSGRKFFSGEGVTETKKSFTLNDYLVEIDAKKHGVLNVINFGKASGFFICQECGYATKHESGISKKHGKCKGSMKKQAIGYELESDVVKIDIDFKEAKVCFEEGFWESFMYALIEGVSEVLEIDRNDIDGTIYTTTTAEKSIVLFDTVPGGAGHVKRLLEEQDFQKVIRSAYKLVNECSCGEGLSNTSCYSCLRNYYNQYCHDLLRRDLAIKGLEKLI